MVTAAQRRQAVLLLQERFGVSERRACRVFGQQRSTQRRQSSSMIALEVETFAPVRDGANQHGFVRAEEIAGIGAREFFPIVAVNRRDIEHGGAEVINGPIVLMGNVPYHG